jgi:anti-sigma regulatory factor (Ser/Thr protein kinase)
MDLKGTQPLVSAQVRGWIATTLADLDAAHQIDVLLVAVELLANAYDHTPGPDRIRLIRHHDPCRVDIEIADTTSRRPTLSSLGTRGRGLLMIERITSDWGVRSDPDGKIVWATVRCDGAEHIPCHGIPRPQAAGGSEPATVVDEHHRAGRNSSSGRLGTAALDSVRHGPHPAGARAIGENDELAALLAAWRADIDSEPVPPMPALLAGLARQVDRLTRPASVADQAVALPDDTDR